MECIKLCWLLVVRNLCISEQTDDRWQLRLFHLRLDDRKRHHRLQQADQHGQRETVPWDSDCRQQRSSWRHLSGLSWVLKTKKLLRKTNSKNFVAAKANAYYNILDTDYDNYAVIFSCNNYYGLGNKFFFQKFQKFIFSPFLVNGQNVWVLGRRNVLEQPFVDRAMAVLDQNRLSRMFLTHTVQNCVQRQAN